METSNLTIFLTTVSPVSYSQSSSLSWSSYSSLGGLTTKTTVPKLSLTPISFNSNPLSTFNPSSTLPFPPPTTK
ncbi:unnamed protein product [Coffea canephora]|uniref:Uncharacterized protein n=1 Tax=Coffea canephora TaxID=49390 RepID=A0A068TUJ0_COFCA|nr:unnamed protein product [Coffea canephora]